MISGLPADKSRACSLLVVLVCALPMAFVGDLGFAAVPVAESVPDVIQQPTAKPKTPNARQVSERVALRYEAYVAGINAGEARLTLERQSIPATTVTAAATGYRVAGTARSKGLWESVQRWRAEYSVDGSTRETGVTPGHFYSLQTTPKKRREIHIENGVLRETKNNKVRDPRPAQTGFDLLSALFFVPACYPELRVHTGRDGYDMRRSSKLGDLSCKYSVEDEDGGRYQMKLSYEMRDGFIVPADIAVQGPLSGRMVLAAPES